MQVAAAMAIVGAVVGLILNGHQPPRFISTVQLRMTTQRDPNFPVKEEALASNAAYKRDMMVQQTMSRGSLTELMLRPGMDLYREERRALPFEDVVLKMRDDLRVRLLNDGFIDVSFAYRDPKRAQAVAQEMAAKFLEENVAINQQRDWVFREAWRRPAPKGENLAVVRAASTPTPASSRVIWVAYGLLAGALLGIAAALVWRRPQWSAQVAAMAALGCAAGIGVSTLVPRQYRSESIMRLTPSMEPRHVSGEVAGTPPREFMEHLRSALLADDWLAEVIQRPKLNLYPALRRQSGLNAALDRVRNHDLHIEMVNDGLSGTPWGGGRFRLAFSYSDPVSARAMVRELIVRFVELHNRDISERTKIEGPGYAYIEERKIGENLEILEPASEGALEPPGIEQWGWAIGLGAGLLAGILLTRQRTTGYSAPPSAVPLPSPPG